MPTGLLVKNIKCLVQIEDVARIKVCGNEMCELNTITDAYLYLKNGFITKEIPSYQFMPYAFGSNLIDTVILRGNVIE